MIQDRLRGLNQSYRRNSDLPTALEYLVLLTAWTQRCKACGALNSEELQQALEASAKEHNVRVEAWNSLMDGR